jgi:small subunit ribosomal protein S8
MPLVHDFCARLQNGFRAGLRKISVPESRTNLGLANVLYQNGFISAIERGSHQGPDPEFTPTNRLNISTRRYWLTLKYKENRPLLSSMRCISKPSRKISLTPQQVEALALGKKQLNLVKAPQLGEVFIIDTKDKQHGIVDLNDALKKKLGGEILCSAV